MRAFDFQRTKVGDNLGHYVTRNLLICTDHRLLLGSWSRGYYEGNVLRIPDKKTHQKCW